MFISLQHILLPSPSPPPPRLIHKWPCAQDNSSWWHCYITL
jgi:hypothetical protein